MNFLKIEPLCILVLAICAIAGCSGCTVTPVKVQSHVASFDGNAQNSGFLQFNPDGTGLITPHARDRYNALIADFGTRFAPPLANDAGITSTGTNTYIIDAEHLAKFATMNRWRREPH